VKIVKNERDPPLFTSKQLIKFKKIIRNTTQVKIEHMVKSQVLGNNSKTVNNIKNLTCGKNDQYIKIYLPCNFEVNPITHFGVISLFSSPGL
jgi:hypothetical protein